MEKVDPFTAKVFDLCQQAIKGVLTLDDFLRMWPQDARANLFLQQVFEDIEDGVEHFPGFWFSGKPDIQSWLRSEMYLTLCIDLILLKHVDEREASQLLQCRKAMLEMKPFSEYMLEDEVRRCLNLKRS